MMSSSRDEFEKAHCPLNRCLCIYFTKGSLLMCNDTVKHMLLVNIDQYNDAWHKTGVIHEQLQQQQQQRVEVD
jgi:hypothetical protein